MYLININCLILLKKTFAVLSQFLYILSIYLYMCNIFMLDPQKEISKLMLSPILIRIH